jgi:5-methylcytosine-specific restriction endonuclease McrA
MRFCEECSTELPRYKRFCEPCAKRRQRLRGKLCEARRRETDPGYRASQAAFHRNRRAVNPIVAAKHREAAKLYARANPKLGAVRAQLWRSANPARVAFLTKRFHAANPGYAAAISNRRRARLLDSRSPGVTPAQWAEICEVSGHACAYCLRLGLKLTRDHVEPISRGGRDEPSNVVPACTSCNSSKGKKLLIIWGAAA